MKLALACARVAETRFCNLKQPWLFFRRAGFSSNTSGCSERNFCSAVLGFAWKHTCAMYPGNHLLEPKHLAAQPSRPSSSEALDSNRCWFSPCCLGSLSACRGPSPARQGCSHAASETSSVWLPLRSKRHGSKAQGLQLFSEPLQRKQKHKEPPPLIQEPLPENTQPHLANRASGGPGWSSLPSLRPPCLGNSPTSEYWGEL